MLNIWEHLPFCCSFQYPAEANICKYDLLKTNVYTFLPRKLFNTYTLSYSCTCKKTDSISWIQNVGPIFLKDPYRRQNYKYTVDQGMKAQLRLSSPLYERKPSKVWQDLIQSNCIHYYTNYIIWSDRENEGEKKSTNQLF